MCYAVPEVEGTRIHNQQFGIGLFISFSVAGILDCMDGTILKPVLLKSKKGQRERYFYELLNGDTTPNEYFDVKRYSSETLSTLRKITPIYKGLVMLAEHPEGRKCSVTL